MTYFVSGALSADTYVWCGRGDGLDGLEGDTPDPVVVCSIMATLQTPSVLSKGVQM